ncbi:hypothetical protein [Sinorhizobium medicae]|nr:hypothetical protein [Sinorhizobium medicae]MDX0524792.1 hypothetical protein [Sinorhizobium medicae]
MTCTRFALGQAINLSTMHAWATLALQATAGATGYLLVLLLVKRFATGMFPVLVVVAPLTVAPLTPTHDIAGL